MSSKTILILWVIMVWLSTTANQFLRAQDQPIIRITAQQQKLGEVLEAFQQQSGIRLVFANSMVDSFVIFRQIADPPFMALRKILRGLPFDFIQKHPNLWVILPRAETRSGLASLSGNVMDAANHHPLDGANVFLTTISLGATTDSCGHFKIEAIPPNRHYVAVQRIGYQDSTLALALEGNAHKNLQIGLVPKLLSVPEMVVERIRLPRPAGALLSQQTLAENQLALSPGRNDGEIFEILHQQPGVSRRDLDDVFPHIEGGSATEVAVELDGMPILVSTHSENRRSIFAAPMIGSVTLHRSGYGPQFGEAMSGVVELHTREIAELDYSTRASVSLNGLTFSARKNFSQWRWAGIARSANFNESLESNDLQAHDLFNKLEYQIVKNKKLTLLSLVSRGALTQSNSQIPVNIFSHSIGLRYSSRADSAPAFSVLFYRSALAHRQQELGLKLEVQRQLSQTLSAYWGAHLFHLQSRGAAALDSVGKLKYVWISFLDYDPSPVDIFDQNATVLSPYLGINVNKKFWRWQIGLRLPTDWQNKIARPEPRTTLTVIPVKNLNMAFSVGRYHQFTDRSYATEAKSGDAIGIGEYIVRIGNNQPSRADHWRSEVSYHPSLAWETSIAIFRKQYDFSGQSYLYRLNRVVWLLPLQRGRSQGVEFWLGKVLGRNQGWMTYTKSHETYTSAPGNRFRPYFDQRHIFSLVFSRYLSGTWQLKAHYEKASGYPARLWAPDLIKIQPAISPEAMAQKYLTNVQDAGAHSQLAFGLSRTFTGTHSRLAVDLVAVNTLAEERGGRLQSDVKFWIAVHVSH